MTYSIKQAAEKFNLTSYTIRYYDKEGLLPFVKRTNTGVRLFSEDDLEWLSLICCLKNTGMQIKEIKKFIEFYTHGDETLEQRRELLLNHKHQVELQMQELEKNMDKIKAKIEFYDTLCAGKTNSRT